MFACVLLFAICVLLLFVRCFWCLLRVACCVKVVVFFVVGYLGVWCSLIVARFMWLFPLFVCWLLVVAFCLLRVCCQLFVAGG